MYDSLNNGQCFQKPRFNYKEYIKAALISPIKAPADAFKPHSFESDDDDENWDDYDDEEEEKFDSEEDGLDIPGRFRSRREERIYLGRGYNRQL